MDNECSSSIDWRTEGGVTQGTALVLIVVVVA